MDNKGYQELVRGYAEQLRKRCEEAAMQGKPLKKDKLEKLTSEVGEFLSKHSELTEERARCEARMAVYTELATKSEQPAPSAVKHTEEKTQDGETERLGTVTAGTNETTGETVYQVRLSDRLTSEEWKAVLLRARNNKGYYYKKGGFFAFRTEEDANNFNNIKPYERDSEKSVTGDLGVQSGLPNGAEKETAAGAAETERKERGVEESIIDVNEKIAIEGDYGEEDEQEEENQEESQEQEKQPAEKTSRAKSSSKAKSQKDQSKTTDWRESLAEFVKAANGLRVEVDEKHLSVTNADGETVVEHTVNDDEIMRIIMPMSHRESIFASGYSRSLSESSLNVFSHIAENPEDLAKVREALESGMSAEQAHDKGESTVSRNEKTSGGDTTTKHPQPKEKTATAKPQKQQASQMSLDFSMTEEESGKEETKKEEVKPDKKTQDNERDNEKDTGVSSRGGDSDNASESTAPDADGSGRDREKSEGDRAGISDGGDGGNEHRGSEGGISTNGRDRGEEPLHAPDRGAENDDTIRGQGESGRGSGVLQTDAGGEIGGEREGQTLGPDERGGEGRADAPDGRKNKQVKKREELPTDLNPNFLTYTDNLPVMGEAGRIEANIAAIKTVYELDMQGRQATPEEQRTMSLYTGFGGINIADGRYSRDYEVRDRIQRLSELIDKMDSDGKNDVYKNLMLSTTTAYYTDIDIAKAINAITEKEGFKGGRWLDPATGSGHFIGTMPESFLHSTEVWGCEPDYITAKIAKYLYPEAHIEMNTLQASDIRNGYFDVVSTNDPFGYTPVEDATWRKAMTAAREVASKSLHGYFAIKKIEAARSGGLVNFITSKGLLDTRSNALVREYIADTCEIIGALRMPNTAFRSSSTRVVADIILLRKFSSDEEKMLFHENEEYRKKIMDPFLTTKEITIKRGEGADDIKVNINSYFEEHPDNILGEIAPGGMYSENEYTVIKADDGLSVAEEIGAQADRILEMRRQMFGETIYTPIGESAVKIADKIEEGEVPYKGLLIENLVTGNLVIQDGKVGVLRLHEDAYGDKTAHFQTNEITSALDIVQTRMYITLRDRLHELMEAQISDEKKDTDTLRKRLHEAYTAYVGKYGRLYDRKSRPMKYDISSSQVFALERTETLAVSRDGSEKTVTKTELTGMAEIYDHDINISKIATTKPETPEEAIMRSLSLYAKIDEQYMEETIGEDWLEKCGDRVYENPNGEYEISEIYLSGDVVTKLEEARRAEKDNEKFGRNVSALEQVQPKKIEFGFFPAHMGARWIPVEIYNEFLQHIFGIKPSKHRGNWEKEVRTNISYYEPLSEYICNFDESEFGGEAYNWTSGPKKCKEIFEAALIDKDIVIYHPATVPGEKKTVDKEATREANAKVQEMRDAFEDWLPTRPDLIEKVEKEYNNRFNRIVLPKWDGSHLETPSLAGMQLRPHQKDAVWMLLNNKGGIVDHMVGAGKTLVMQTAVMEMRRTGIARKPMLLVWKSTIDQVVQSFQEAYPMAKILAPSKNDFSPENRDRFFAQIALNEYDAIIVTHDQFEKFNHTKEARLSSYREELAQLEATKLMLGEQREQTQISKKVQGELAKKIKNLQAKIEKAEQKQEDCKYYFEKMGIDCLIVDESHSFKNLRYFTQYSGVAGVGDPDGSNKSNNLLIAIRHIQKMNGGDRGVVFLSGTTISNSLTEMYNIFNYLRPEKMRQMGLNTFDAWASTFARRSTEAEFGVTTELKARTRFRRFEAIKELSALYNEISDVRNSKNLTLPRPAEKSHLVTIKPSETVEMLNKEIIKMVKNQNGDFFGLVTNDKSPWGLLASNLGKKLTVSPKLIDEKFDDERGKIFHLTENIKHIYDKFEEQKGVQLVFLDTGISHGDGKWNAYDAIIKSLNEDYGIPKEQIADIHDADSDVKRKALFTRVNNGEVRILIGGTKNMGTGVNVQKRVVAMHHMDIPWTPADVEQRNGRGVRQGNEVARDYNNNEVDIYYYAVEHTIDTYRYQLQDTKGKMIDMFKSSSADMEAGATFEEQDGDEEGMKWATMMSILSGNPLILEKKKCEDKVETLERRKRGFIRDQAKKRQLHKETLEKKEKMEALVRYNGYDKERLERKGFVRDEKGNWPKIKVRLYSNEISAGEYELNTQFGEELQKRVLAFENLELRAYGASAKINILPYKNDGRNVYEMNLEVSSAIKYTHTLQSSAQSWGAAFGVVLHKVINNAEKYVEENARLEQMLKTMPTGEEAFPKEQELLLAKATLEDVTKRYEAMADAEDKEEKKESGLKAFINEVTSGRVSTPIKARETILEYNVKYAMSASDEERSQVIKEAVEKLTGVSVVMYNKKNVYEVAKQNGENENELQQIKETFEAAESDNLLGFVTSDKDCIYISSECGSIRKALAIALHEWQHQLNKNETRDIEQIAEEYERETLLKALKVFNENEYYDKRETNEIVDEIIAYAVYQQFNGNNPEQMLKKAGIEEKLINKINEKTHGNRTSYSKFISRWDAPYNRDEQKSVGKDVRDKSQGPAEVAKKGYDPDEAGEAGARNTIDFYVEKALASGGYKATESAGATTYTRLNDTTDGEYVGVIRESVDTRNGERIFVVEKKRYVTREEFSVLCERAREYGGYYTTFPQNRGFIFRTEEEAENFNHITKEEVVVKEDVKINQKTETDEIPNENRSGIKNQPTQNESENAQRGTGRENEADGRTEGDAGEKQIDVPSYTEQEEEWNYRLDLLQAQLRESGYEQQKRKLAINDEGARLLLTFRNEKGHELKIYSSKTDKRTNSEFELNISENEGKSIGADSIFNSEPLTNSRIQSYLEELGILTNIGSINEPLLLVDDLVNISKREAEKEEKDFETANTLTEETTELIGGATVTHKIQDYGEHIRGARKDEWSTIAKELEDIKQQSLLDNPLSKVFKKPNLQQLKEEGMSDEDIIMVRALTDNIERVPKPAKTKSRWDTRRQDWAKETFNKISKLRDYIVASEKDREETRKYYHSIEAQGMRRFDDEDYIAFDLALLENLNFTAEDKMDNFLRGLTIEKWSGMYVSRNSKIIAPSTITDDKELLQTVANSYRLSRGDVEGTEVNEKLIGVTPNETARRESETHKRLLYGKNFLKASQLHTEDVPKEKINERIAELESRGMICSVHPLYETYNKNYVIFYRNILTGEITDLTEKLFETVKEASDYISSGEAAELIRQRAAEEAQKNSVNEKPSKESAVKIPEINVYRYRYKVEADGTLSSLNGKFAIAIAIPAKQSPTGKDYIFGYFDTGKEAYKYLNEHLSELQDEIRNVIESNKQNRVKVFFQPNMPRKGEDYRKGENITPEKLAETFGFRGVQFGNWANDQDRQQALNETYDALKDLAREIGFEDKMLSLNGELGIAFGARGGGNASAHYEPGEVVINLTKTKGAGSLAHEWMHAIDNYFSRREGDKIGMITDKNLRGIRNGRSIEKAVAAINRKMSNSNYSIRCSGYGDYWNRPHEKWARLFAEWVHHRIEERGESNHYLSRGIDQQLFENTRKNSYQLYIKHCQNIKEEPLTYEQFKERHMGETMGIPYPTKEESMEYTEMFKELFRVMGETIKYDEHMKEQKELMVQGEREEESLLVGAGLSVNRDIYDFITDQLERCNLEVRYERMEDKAVKGYAQDYTITLNTNTEISLETPLHEYTHIWCAAMERENPEEWERIKAMLKGTIYYKDVLTDSRYADIAGDDDRVASETLARISGRQGAKRMIEIEKKYAQEMGLPYGLPLKGMRDKALSALKSLWNWTAEHLLTGRQRPRNVEEVADLVLNDLLSGRDLRSKDIAKSDEEYKKLDSRLAKTTSESERKEILDEMQRIVNQEASDTLKDAVTREKSGQLSMFILSRSDLEKLHSKGALRLTSLNKEDTAKMQSLRNNEVAGTGLTLEDAGLNPVLEEIAKEGFMTVFANLKRPVRFEERQILGKNEKMLRQMAKEKDPDADGIIYLNELDNRETIVFSEDSLYAADVLTQDEKDGKSLSERFASHDSEKEYFIKEKTSQETFNILKEAIERAGLKINVVDKNKILDMLLSSPRFMGRIPSERNGAVSGNSSSWYLDAECEVHLSRIASTDSKSATKLQKETEITRKAIRKIKREGLDNIKTRNEDTIVREISSKIHLRKSHSSNSFYGDFYEGDYNVNGKTVRLRISTHPANPANFNNAPTDDIISLVVYKNGLHKGTGEREYDEYTYRLSRISGDEIVKLIVDGTESLLDSGVFLNTNPLVEVRHYEGASALDEAIDIANEISEQTAGWAENGEVFLTEKGLEPETLIHEYTHIWCAALEKSSPKEWEQIKELLKETIYWEDVTKDDNYKPIRNDEDRMASETLARISGKRGAETMKRIEEQSSTEKSMVSQMREKALRALEKFWKWTSSFFGVKKPIKAEEVADMVLSDLLGSRKLNTQEQKGRKEYFITGKRGAAALDDLDMMHRMDDLRTAMQYDRAGISAHDIKAGFFWEKGANGSWMYEVPLTDFASIEGRIGAETDYDGHFSGTFSLDDLPELKKLYPDEQLEIEININPSAERDRGYYHVKTEDAPGKITLNLRNTRYLKRGIVHEAQHFAQDMEGMPLGTSATEIEKAKQTVRQLLKIEDGQTNDARLISDRIRTAGAEELEKSKRTAMAFGCDINHLLQTPTQYLYMTNYGETITRASVNRTLEKGLETEEDYASSLIRTELMFSAEDLWTGGRPETMEWKVNGEGYVYNDNGQPLKENEYREYQKQLKEELTAAADGDRIRFYVPLSEKEVNEMVKYGYSLPNRTQNAITTTRQIARPGVPLVVTVDIPTDNVDSIRRNATHDGYILPLLKSNSYRIASIRQSNEPKMFSYGGILFCRQDGATNKTRKAREEQVRIMAKAIEKIFPEEMRNRTKILTHEEYERLGNDMSDYIPSSIAVAEKDGMVYIDAERARVDTPLHELGVHRLMDIARRYSLNDIEKAILRYGETAPEPIKSEVRRVYPDIEEKSDLYKEECAAMALGLQQQYRIEQFLQKEEYKGWYVRLTNYISGTLNKIKSVFLGKQYADLTPLQCLEGLGHEVIGNRLFSLIMSGREIKVDNRKKLQYIGETRAQVIGENGIKNLAASGKYSEQAVIRYGETIGSTYAKYLAIEGTENARDPKLLRLATDMFRSSIDRKLRMEIVSPSFVPDKVLQEKLDGRTTLHLKDLLTEDNAILTAYPQLREAEIVGAVRNNINNDFANIQKEYEEVYDETAVGEIRYRVSVFKQTLKEWKQSLVHELQHAIQTIEGFEEGYPFTTPLKTKEIEFLKKHTASMTATQLKHLSQSVSNEYLEQYGIRRKAIPTIRELLSLGKTKLEREIKEIDEGLRRYTANAGENEAYAASARMDLTKEQRLERPFSMDYFVDETRQEPSPINEFLRKTGQTIEYNLFNMKDNMLSFAEQRARVSIIEIAQHYGYRVIPKQGMRCPILIHEGTGDKIGILNPSNPASQGYWTIGDDSNKGVLYNFVATRVEMGIIPNTLPYPENQNPNFIVNKVVHDYLNIPIEIRQKNQNLQKRIADRLENAETAKDFEKYCKEFEKTDFLSRRGMAEETISSPLFKGRIFNLDQKKLVEDSLIAKEGDQDTIGIPLYNSAGEMVGLERRCDDIKMFLSGSQKGTGVWHSNIPEQITDVVICETALDAIAYHELLGNNNTLYFATAGNVCVEQINQINEILRANNSKVNAKEFRMHLANDNDKAGAAFNLQYVKAQLRLKRECASDNLPTEGGYTQTLLSFKTAEQRNKVLERLKTALSKMQEQITDEKNELTVRISDKNEQMKESILIQSKSGDMYATQALCDALIEAAELNRTKVEKSVTKDFNDDLRLLNLVNSKEEKAQMTYLDIKTNKQLFEPEIRQILDRTKKPTATQLRNQRINSYIARHSAGPKR